MFAPLSEYWDRYLTRPDVQARIRGENRSARPSHYGDNDPYKFSLDNGLGPLEMNIVKYITRWRKKDGIRDLRKARDTLERLIAYEEDSYTGRIN